MPLHWRVTLSLSHRLLVCYFIQKFLNQCWSCWLCMTLQSHHFPLAVFHQKHPPALEKPAANPTCSTCIYSAAFAPSMCNFFSETHCPLEKKKNFCWNAIPLISKTSYATSAIIVQSDTQTSEIVVHSGCIFKIFSKTLKDGNMSSLSFFFCFY